MDHDYIFAGLAFSDCVYVFDRKATNWSQLAKLTPFDGPGRYFGYSVAVSGETLVVGAPADNNVAGAAYVFRRDGSNWTCHAKLRASDIQAWNGFGWAVAIDHQKMVIGSGRYGGGTEAGIGYVFVNNGATWVEEAQLRPTNRRLIDNGGIQVALSGEHAAINYSGYPAAVHLYQRSNDSWYLTQTIGPTNAPAEFRFGRSLQMTGSRLAIGAPGSNLDSQSIGRVHLFTLKDGAWAFDEMIESPPSAIGQVFGSPLALGPNGICVGARERSLTSNTGGSAFLFESDLDPPVVHSVTSNPSILWPPNRKLIPVAIEVAATDNCRDVSSRISAVSQTGDEEGSWQITGDLTLNLRAIGNNDGTERTYQVTIESRDVSGNLSRTNVSIVVPHDIGRDGKAGTP